MKNLIWQSFIYTALFYGSFFPTNCSADELLGEINADLRNTLQSLFNETEVKVTDYDESLKLVKVKGEVYFASADGRYLFTGKVIDIHNKSDVREAQVSLLRQDYLRQQPDDVFVRYPSTTPEQYEVVVFTDIDCPYCRQLHRSITQLNQAGVSVNYVMLPRGGNGTPAYEKTLAALCADDPGSEITQAMQGQSITADACTSDSHKETQQTRIRQHRDLARQLRVMSTPSIVLPNGELKLGLIPPEELLALLQYKKESKGVR